MYKVIMKEKSTGDILISKQFNDEQKAEIFKTAISKYLNKDRAEVIVENKGEKNE